MLNTRHSVRSVLHLLAVVCEVARGRTGSRKIPTSINVANEDSVTGVTELGVQPAHCACLLDVALRPQEQQSRLLGPKFKSGLFPEFHFRHAVRQNEFVRWACVSPVSRVSCPRRYVCNVAVSCGVAAALDGTQKARKSATLRPENGKIFSRAPPRPARP